MYFYRKGCWCPRRLTESDEGYEADNDELNLNFEFRHDLLGYIQFNVPLVFVNREARSIALAWVREQGIEIRPREYRQSHVFVRSFDPMRDALYIALDKWDDVFNEYYDRQHEPDMFEQVIQIGVDLTRIAVPEALLRSEDPALHELFWLFPRLEVLFIIFDAQPDLQSTDNDMKVQRRWEFESTHGGALFWNNDRADFDLEDSEHIGDEALYRLIEEANRKKLGVELAGNYVRSFEIRPVFAIRK